MTMNNASEANDRPILILIRGLPGSGKSYLAKALQERLGPSGVTLLDPDATDYESPAYQEHTKRLSEDGVDAKLHPYRFLRTQAYAAIEAHGIIIWNQAFTNLETFQKMIANLQAYADDHGTELPILVVEVEIDQETAKARVAERASQGGHDVDAENFARFIRDYRSFAGEGFETVTIQGAGDVQTSVYAVLESLSRLRG